MKITSAKPHTEVEIKAFLQTCNLPFADLRPTHLQHFFIVENGDQLDAVIGLEVCGEFGLLRSLAVAPSQRGQGLGTQLVEHLESYARLQHISALCLLTTTADQFFAKLDYQVISRSSVPAPLQATAEFKSICPTSAICMQKQL